MLNHIGPVRPRGRRTVTRLLACSILTTTAIGGAVLGPVARAQTAATVPVRESIDANGVDLFLGTMNADGPALSAGQSGAQGLAYKLIFRGGGSGDNLMASLSVSGSSVVIYIGGKADRFTVSGSTYTGTEGNGTRLSLSGNVYTYIMADGSVAHFTKNYVGAYPYGTTTGLITDLTRPGGEVLTYSYDGTTYCAANKPSGGGYICTQTKTAYRIGSVTNNSKYRLNYLYGNWDSLDWDPDQVPNNTYWTGWGDITAVSMTNTAVPGASVRTQSFGSSGGVYNVTDEIGRTTGYRSSAGGLLGITRPGSSAEDVTVTYSGGRVSAVTTAAGTTSYSSYDSSGVRYVTVTPPNAGATNYTFDIASQRMTSRIDPLSRTTSWQYDASGRVTRITQPDGNYTQLTYDSRGNVTEKRAVAKSGSGLADVVTPADYDASCISAAKCNQPNWTKDAKGNQTDYTYNTSTGNLLTVAAPAATSGGTRPTTTYSYTTVNGAQQVSSISACQTSASCAGTADEVKISISYDINGLPNVVSKGAGDGSLTATTTIAYDDVGNARTVDGPLPGTADTTRYRYDAARQLVGVVSADPDGAGPLKPRAQRTTYDPKGRVTLTETGNVNSQSDGDWAGFTSLQQAATDYDGVDRPVKQTASAGGTIYQVTQRSYDAAGTYDCSAVRMNSATWGSLPGACTATTTGAAGPDRITRNLYNSAREVTTVQTAYGTADQANEATSAYTNNGKLASVTDGEGNKTSYEYDGFDRLSKTSYPVTTAGSGTSSGSDYEQLGYDAASNVTSRRLRDGQTITYGYDNLNRVTSKVTPGSAPNWDVAYSYDLLGRVTNATGDGWAVNAFTYDALGRVVTEQNYNAPTYHAYDLAGRQTRLTWYDGFHADYDYYVTGEVTAIRENGATSGAGVLATYAYDDLGRRTSVTRGNGTTTSYGYDAVSRLTSLTQDLAGSAYDFTHGFSYNPAGQIASLTRSNDAYAWNGHYNVDRGYGINGLNQATSAGSTSIGYDGRGNLTSSGSSGYGYTVENQLVSGPGVTMNYEPGGGQLLQSYNTGTGVDTRFLWSGSQMIGEINAGSAWTLIKRYVPGPGVDETVTWYEGSGTSDRRWLHTDERGSVVAATNGSGNVIGVNSYDEYGIPAAGNIGRFQYTGQAWLPELGMYYYKARIYSPTLGRFMQTDSVGYTAGLNLYAYTGGDPINLIDPTGHDVTCNDGYIISSENKMDEPCVDHGGVDSNSFTNGPGTHSYGIFSGSILFGISGGDFGISSALSGGGWGAQTTQATNPNISQEDRGCPSSGLPSTGASGVWGGASIEAGIGAVGAGGQASVSRLRFDNGTVVNYMTTGGFAGTLNQGKGLTLGAAAGIGGGLTFSNAGSPSDLTGEAMTYNVNVAIFSGSLSLGNGGIFSLNLGIAKGLGLDVSGYKTNTKILSTGCYPR